MSTRPSRATGGRSRLISGRETWSNGRMASPETSAILLESQTLRWKSGDWSIPASAELPSFQPSAGQASSSSGPCCDPIRTGYRGQVRQRFGVGGRASANPRDLAWPCDNKQARPYGVPQMSPSRPGHCIASNVFDAVYLPLTMALQRRRRRCVATVIPKDLDIGTIISNQRADRRCALPESRTRCSR